ncbi:TPA: hypothetical protein HA241_01045 [Candidatus Woesearchaeota archaeon]|nr:hypothetical protein [Candidatus Woesearchaeota archaeon]
MYKNPFIPFIVILAGGWLVQQFMGLEALVWASLFVGAASFANAQYFGERMKNKS